MQDTFGLSPLVIDLIFTENFVDKTNDRNKLDDLRAMGNLCRFHDIKLDTNLHEKFTSWIKKKKIKWNNTTYQIPKEQLSIKQVLQNILKLKPLYSNFTLFLLTSGLRTIQKTKRKNLQQKTTTRNILDPSFTTWLPRTNKRSNKQN